jgi:hypothetical protein
MHLLVTLCVLNVHYHFNSCSPWVVHMYIHKAYEIGLWHAPYLDFWIDACGQRSLSTRLCNATYICLFK